MGRVPRFSYEDSKYNTVMDDYGVPLDERASEGDTAGPGGDCFWKNNISYALRGSILIELVLRQRISIVRDPGRKCLSGIDTLRTEKTNFLFFSGRACQGWRSQPRGANRTSTVPPQAMDAEGLVCSAYTASILDNAFGRLGYEEREAAFGRCNEILAEFAGHRCTDRATFFDDEARYWDDEHDLWIKHVQQRPCGIAIDAFVVIRLGVHCKDLEQNITKLPDRSPTTLRLRVMITIISP
ncbi:GPP34-domain-containing protein [Mycena indigotica]|uniref:GPP34-domain-containing protein n=1 Tax=Mycena indigotica TaxID=2126181 RepID=A0A8H6VZA3_9AGAR|nr:GPP34-domain-containing protein [Mycena indigotica]KAF7293604.1 GPP34-domain-containing protein [Mycena indigotica]